MFTLIASVFQDLPRISKAIEDGDFFENEELLKAAENCRNNNSALHVFGLVSDGGVHSHNSHLYALLRFANKEGLEKVFVHAFLDGRDTPPTSGKEYIKSLEEQMREIGTGKIASVMGRYYSMDRDNRWARVEKAYNVMTTGKGNKFTSAEECIEKSYEIL